MVVPETAILLQTSIGGIKGARGRAEGRKGGQEGCQGGQEGRSALLLSPSWNTVSLTWLKIETPNTPLNAERSQQKAISLVETNATRLLIGRKQNPEYTAREHLRSIHSEVHSSKCCLGQSETSKRRGNSRSFNNMNFISNPYREVIMIIFVFPFVLRD